MAALNTTSPISDDNDDLHTEVASLSRVELIQMVVMGLGVGVEKTGAVVPSGWETIAADYLNATLQATEVVGFVHAFSNADKATLEGVVNKFLASDAAAKKTLEAFDACIARTGADVPAGWQFLITELAKLGALSCEKMESLQTYAETAGKDELEGVLMQFAQVLKERASRHREAQEKALQEQQGGGKQGGGKQRKPAAPTPVRLLVAPELAAVVEAGDLPGLKRGAANYVALVARPEVSGKARKALSGQQDRKGGGSSSSSSTPLADEKAVLLGFLEQEFNDSGILPRVSFAVASKGHVGMLRWMLEQGVEVNGSNKLGERLIHYAASFTARTEEEEGDNGRGPGKGTAEATAEAETQKQPVEEEAGDGIKAKTNAKTTGCALVELLLAFGASATVATRDGVTPLHLAALGGDVGAVKALLALGDEEGGDGGGGDSNGARKEKEGVTGISEGSAAPATTATTAASADAAAASDATTTAASTIIAAAAAAAAGTAPEAAFMTDKGLALSVLECSKTVHEAMCRNFDTPAVLASLVKLVKFVNVYLSPANSPHTAAKPAVPLLRKAAAQVTKVLRVLGVVEGADDLGFPLTGLGGGASGGGEGGGGQEELLAPFLDAFRDFRHEVRSLMRGAQQGAAATAKNKNKEGGGEGGGGEEQALVATGLALAACDTVRDHVLPRLGVKLEDVSAGVGAGPGDGGSGGAAASSAASSRWKLDDPAVLVREIEEKLEKEAAARAEKAAKQLSAAKKKLGDATDASADPKTLFSGGARAKEFSAFGEADGVPTHAAVVKGEGGGGSSADTAGASSSLGEPLSKSALKSLAKERANHEKKHTKLRADATKAGVSVEEHIARLAAEVEKLEV